MHTLILPYDFKQPNILKTKIHIPPHEKRVTHTHIRSITDARTVKLNEVLP